MSTINPQQLLGSGGTALGAQSPIEVDEVDEKRKELELVSELIERESSLRTMLTSTYSSWSRFWALYLGQVRDRRKEGEEWRAAVHVPYAYSGVESMCALMLDLFTSADPMVQLEAVDAQNEQRGRALERHIDFSLRTTRFTKKLDQALRTMAVQGTAMLKVVQTNRSNFIYVEPTLDKLADFTRAVEQAEQATGLQAPENPVEFDQWREMVNSSIGIPVPEFPKRGLRKVSAYEGPDIVAPSLWNMRLHPLIADINEQPIIMQRSLVTADWIRDRTGEGEDKPFSPEAVEDALGRGGAERMSEWEKQQAALMGFGSAEIGERTGPTGRQIHEIWECWIRDPGREPMLVHMLNRSRIINKDRSWAYVDGDAPFVPIRNVAVEGHFFGLSELSQNERLYYEMDALRSLRLDAVLLNVLPALAVQQGTGIADVLKKIAPGDVVPLPQVGGIQRLLGSLDSGIMAAFREIGEIKNDIDETNATGANLRGAPSSIGRVSASESRDRLNQAQSRHKAKALRLEEEMIELPRKILSRWYQFGPEAVRIRIGGGGQMGDVFYTLKEDDLLWGLEQDFRLRGATKVLNKDMAVQQLMGFFQAFQPMLGPMEVRYLMKEILDTSGIKGSDQIVSEQWTQMLVQQAMGQMMQPPIDQGAPPTGAEGEAPPEGPPPEEQMA